VERRSFLGLIGAIPFAIQKEEIKEDIDLYDKIVSLVKFFKNQKGYYLILLMNDQWIKAPKFSIKKEGYWTIKVICEEIKIIKSVSYDAIGLVNPEGKLIRVTKFLHTMKFSPGDTLKASVDYTFTG
jgi:hypothetical protein